MGGGWLIWQCMRSGRALYIGLIGGAILILSRVIPALQPVHFSRTYAAYGGVFIVVSLIWGWIFDGKIPDRGDLAGAALCLIGVAVILYTPRIS